MDEQNEDRTSRRKFLTGASLAGAAAVVATPAAAKLAPSGSEFSPEQISKLEEVVKELCHERQGGKYPAARKRVSDGGTR